MPTWFLSAPWDDETGYQQKCQKIVGEATWDKALHLLYQVKDRTIWDLDWILEALHPGCTREGGNPNTPFTSMDDLLAGHLPRVSASLADDCGREYAE